MYDWPQALWVVPSDWRCVASLLSPALVTSLWCLSCLPPTCVAPMPRLLQCTTTMVWHVSVAMGLLMSVSVGASHLWRVGVGWRTIQPTVSLHVVVPFVCVAELCLDMLVDRALRSTDNQP